MLKVYIITKVAKAFKTHSHTRCKDNFCTNLRIHKFKKPLIFQDVLNYFKTII